MNYKTIGILGGMGPEATAKFYLEIIKIFQDKYDAKYDSDFPQIIINSIPLKDIVENNINEKEAEEFLIKNASLLEKAGADFISIPCNSVSKFIPSIRKAVNIPVLSIIDEVINRVSCKKVGLLATNYTLNNSLYEFPLKEKNKEVIKPSLEEQKDVTKAIISVLSNKNIEEAKSKLSLIIEKLRKKGAREIILGCTELPILVNKEEYLLDSLQILAEKAVTLAIELAKESIKNSEGDRLS